MKISYTDIVREICDGSLTEMQKVALLQNIALELNIHTTSDFAKTNNLSYNGVKNHRPSIVLGGVKFHSKGIEENNLPF